MRYFFIVLTVICCHTNAGAQNAADSVKAVINSMFEAMKNADPVMLRHTFSDSMVLQTISRNELNEVVVISQNAAAFVDFISNQKPGNAEERISFDVVKIDGPLAIAWTPYEFYYKGKFSHCGVNSFQLVRFAGAWKIQYLIDTRRQQGCKDQH